VNHFSAVRSAIERATVVYIKQPVSQTSKGHWGPQLTWSYLWKKEQAGEPKKRNHHQWLVAAVAISRYALSFGPR